MRTTTIVTYFVVLLTRLAFPSLTRSYIFVANGQSGLLAGSVSVKADNGSMKPVANALIDIYRTDSKGHWETRTDSGGMFVRLGLAYGFYCIVATAPGIQPVWKDNISVERRREPISLVTFPGEGVRPTLDQIRSGATRPPHQPERIEPKRENLEPLPSASIETAPKIPPWKRYQHSAEIKTNYDKFKDRTFVMHEQIPAGATAWFGNDTLHIQTGFSYEGKSVHMPSSIVMLFHSKSTDWKFLRSPSLIILADGNRFDLGKVVRADSKVLAPKQVYEMLAVEIPVNIFLKIVNSSKVECQLGVMEFELTEERLETLRDLASRLRP